MSVIEGEGRVSILYGDQPMPAPPHRSAYIARPDVVGRHPGVVIAHPDERPRPAVRDLARRLARHGYVAVVPNPSERAIESVVDAFPHGWSDFVRGGAYGVVAIGSGLQPASVVLDDPDAHLVVVQPPADPGGFAGLAIPMLVFAAGEDAPALRDQVDHGTWVIYKGLEPGFWDSHDGDFSAKAFDDALERMVAFLDRHLGFVVAG